MVCKVELEVGPARGLWGQKCVKSRDPKVRLSSFSKRYSLSLKKDN